MVAVIDAFLRGLDTAATLTGDDRLSSEQVNGLGETLGISSGQIVECVERLKQENAIDLHWGGKVSLTPTGRERAAGKSPSAGGNTYNLTGAGAIFAPNASGPVGHAVGANASNMAFGGAAVGQGSALVISATGDLAAALQILQQHQATLPAPASTPALQLAQEVKATIQAAQEPTPDKKTIESRISRARTLADEVAGIAEVGVKFTPALSLIGEALNKVAQWVGYLPGP